MKKCENFDERDVYKKELEPLIEKIHDICIKHSIPMSIVLVPASFDISTMAVLTGVNPPHRFLAEMARVRKVFMHDGAAMSRQDGAADMIMDALKDLAKFKEEKKGKKEH